MSFRGTKFNQPIAPYSQPQQVVQQEEPFDFNKIIKKIEDLLDISIFKQIKPFIPQIGRFLIVATFYEDSIRIITQWSDQIFYLTNYRKIPQFITIPLLLIIVILMLIASTLVVLRKHQIYSSLALIFVIITQGLMYGLFSGGSNFILRNFSLIGGLLIAFSDTLVKEKQKFAGLPDISNNSNYKNYILLTGRILLVLLFLSFAITKSWLTTIITSIGIFAIAFGFKTRFASIVLITILLFYNFSQNSYWFGNLSSAKRDFLKYEFFQTLSIIGGLLLVVNTGAGELSLDEKKKVY